MNPWMYYTGPEEIRNNLSQVVMQYAPVGIKESMVSFISSGDTYTGRIVAEWDQPGIGTVLVEDLTSSQEHNLSTPCHRRLLLPRSDYCPCVQTCTVSAAQGRLWNRIYSLVLQLTFTGSEACLYLGYPAQNFLAPLMQTLRVECFPGAAGPLAQLWEAAGVMRGVTPPPDGVVVLSEPLGKVQRFYGL